MEISTASIFMEELRLTEREAIDGRWITFAHELFFDHNGLGTCDCRVLAKPARPPP